METNNNVFDFLLRMFLVLETCTELKIPHPHQQHQYQHHHSHAANTNSNLNDYNDNDNANDNDNDMKHSQNDDTHYSYGNGMDHIDEEKFRGIHGLSSKTVRDLAAGKEKLVIAAAPQSLKNCNDELNNCKRINRERLCKLEFYKTYCCLTCHGYY